ncbi:hypothetical protein M430DRAFT_28380 [Amorphotheca resinae ATCC 22711]|uniref:Uncharacterized protein n=1 Tax=Amorphotheca resinae ATCC 22711 TaxID=857342 RepID=A0A2T3AZN4_AMORE|nr:hypothetical protein M430DRAFT_28380 [Amorphotheca resinae ATCC 22711]PSS16618.1 hypothetical protein M430DRAFT_28380 [Amorphotheca resinae ATCC 22711]
MKSIRAYGKLYQTQVAADSHLHPTAQPMDSDFAGWASNGGPAVLIPEKREGGVVVTRRYFKYFNFRDACRPMTFGNLSTKANQPYHTARANHPYQVMERHLFPRNRVFLSGSQGSKYPHNFSSLQPHKDERTRVRLEAGSLQGNGVRSSRYLIN